MKECGEGQTLVFKRIHRGLKLEWRR